jgi:TPP-dependent 2-oxoacid decarboxylase
MVSFSSFGQINSGSKAYNDSMLTVLIKGVPKSKQADFKNMYNSMSNEQKRFYEAMALPISSKKELIENIETNYSKIKNLIEIYDTLVPTDMTLYIEFKPPEKQLNLGETIDYRCIYLDKTLNSTEVLQEWDVELTSPKLSVFLNKVKWDRSVLFKIKAALKEASCISIENTHPVEIGFARSGMGKYYYMIFPKPLSTEEAKKYNDECDHIFYKENIVLMYEGGAAGSQCFPYEE